MAVELEAKVQVPSHEPIRVRLREMGAEFIRTALEFNRFFDQPDGSLHQSGCGVRLRSVVVEEGKTLAAKLTFKGPLTKGAMKQREELETSVDDPDAMAAILNSLGLVERIAFEKRRESWELESCEIELDDLPRVGRFVEVEGPSEEQIRSILQRMGLEREPIIKESYVAMIAKNFPVPSDTPIIARF